MPQSFDLLSLLLVVVLFQGIFILSVLFIKHKLNSSQHVLLFLMVLTLVWFQAEFLSIRFPYNIRFDLFYGTRYGAWFLLGPLFYLYVQSIIGKRFSKRDVILHFAPFTIFVLILPVAMAHILSFGQVNYGMLSAFYSFNHNVSFLQYVYSTIFIIQFIHLLIYLTLSARIIRRYDKNVKGNYSSIDTGTLRWLKTINLLLMLVLGLVALFLTLFFLTHAYDRNLDYLYVFPTALIVYLVSYRLAGVQWPLSQPADEKVGKYEKSSLKADHARIYSQQLEDYLNRNKPYLKNELRLQELSELVNIPLHHLSQVINENLKTTFFDYINRHRVEEAKTLIQKEPESSLLEIAFKAGFNNKTSFTNAFRKFTTQTPVEYRRQLVLQKN